MLANNDTGTRRLALRHRLRSAAAALSASLMLPSAAPAQAEAPTTDRFVRAGVYVVASDVARSAAFYEALFEREPTIRSDAFVGFDVAGGLFAIASRATFAPRARLGGTVVPYLRVRDIDAEFARVRRFAPASLRTKAIVREGSIALFKFADLDGNIVEFFALTPPPS